MSQLGGMGATPARRSARLSQAGSVTQQSVVTTMTTGGTRQRKKAALTKVKPRKSNAYGASGRVGAAEELAPTATGFAQAFQDQRGDAVARDDDDDDEEPDDVDELGVETPRMSGALNGRVPHLSPTPQPEASPMVPGLSFMDSEDIARSESGIAASVGNTSKSFGPNHEAGMLYRPMRMDPPQIQAQDGDDGIWRKPLWQVNRARRFNPRAEERNEPEAPAELPDAAVPVIDNEPQPPIAEIVAQEKARLQRGGPPEPRDPPRRRGTRSGRNNANVDIWLGGVEEAEDQPEDEPEWSWKKYAMPLFWVMVVITSMLLLPQAYDAATSSKPGVMNATNIRLMHAYDSLVDWIHPGGTGFQKRITTELLEETGFITRETFDKAIVSFTKNYPHFLIVRREDDSSVITDEFWQAFLNKAASPEGEASWNAFLDHNEERLQNIFGKRLDHSPKDPHSEAVSREEFLRLMQESYQKLATQIDEKVFQAVKGQASQIKAIAEAETRKAMIDSIRLQTLAQSNLLANYELNLRKVNYFSIGLGALIDPRFTSTTLSSNHRDIFSRLFVPSRPRNPPSAALDKWDEAGDCWCAAPNPKRGTAELTVSLPTPVFPQQVTIEHVPMSMMPRKKITNAPRTVELWVETDQSAHYQYANQEQMCQDGLPGWTCLGSFTYNIHAPNHQQTFDLDARSSVPVTKAMLRVRSNWGADYTCLYRVRLHGRDAEEDHQYDVHLKDPVS